jgi:P4 family phage/plasmid primase-like protien
LAVEVETLIDLHKIGFKLVPLGEDAKTPNVSGLLTEEEKQRSISESSDGKEHPFNYIYNHPEFWNEQRLEREAWRFDNVATTFGKTHLKDKDGNDLYLNLLDIDSEQVFTRLAIIYAKNEERMFINEMCNLTYVTQTKKKWGRHIFWLSHQQNSAIGTKDCKPGCEFEIKTDNTIGLATLHPSRHRDNPNFHYQLIGQKTISIQDGLYDGIVKVLADCIKIENNNRSISEKEFKSTNHDNNGKYSNILTEAEIEEISESLRPYYHKGCNSRNDIVFCLCGICHKNNISKESMHNLIQRLAIDDEEKRSRLLVLEETYKKDPKQVSGCKRLLEVLEHATGNAVVAKDIFQKIFHIITSKICDGDGRKIDNVTVLTDQLTDENAFKTFKDTEEILYYDDNKGVYLQGGEWLIKEQCEILCPQIQTCKVQEVVNHIKRRTGVERSMFDSYLNILNLQNGLLNIETGEFKHHSPEHLSLVQLPIAFDPKAKCPSILKFLGQVLHPQDVFTAMQIIGYCLYRNNIYEKAIMLPGPGANGKGVFIKLIESFVGLENTSHVPLQDLDKDRFAAADLYGKMVNTFADLKAEKLSSTGMFKTLVSGDTVRAQEKYGQPFSFRNYAKLIFSTNKIPESEDKSYAYYRRWLILPFENVLEKEDRDTKLIDKLNTPDELSGLLNLALIALKQLHKDEGFKDVSVEKIRKEYDQNSDTVKAFLDDRCVIDLTAPEFYTLTTNLYNEYIIFCKDRKERPLEMNIFGKKLAEHGIERERMRYCGGREYCYMGIKLRSELRGQNQASIC